MVQNNWKLLCNVQLAHNTAIYKTTNTWYGWPWNITKPLKKWANTFYKTSLETFFHTFIHLSPNFLSPPIISSATFINLSSVPYITPYFPSRRTLPSKSFFDDLFSHIFSLFSPSHSSSLSLAVIWLLKAVNLELYSFGCESRWTSSARPTSRCWNPLRTTAWQEKKQCCVKKKKKKMLWFAGTQMLMGKRERRREWNDERLSG